MSIKIESLWFGLLVKAEGHYAFRSEKTLIMQINRTNGLVYGLYLFLLRWQFCFIIEQKQNCRHSECVELSIMRLISLSYKPVSNKKKKCNKSKKKAIFRVPH